MSSPSGSGSFPLHLQSSSQDSPYGMRMELTGSPTGSQSQSPLNQRQASPPGYVQNYLPSTSGVIHQVPGMVRGFQQFSQSSAGHHPEPVSSPSLESLSGTPQQPMSQSSNNSTSSPMSRSLTSPPPVSTPQPNTTPPLPVVPTPTSVPVAPQSTSSAPVPSTSVRKTAGASNAAASSGAASSSSAKTEPPPLLSKEKIEQIAKSVDPNLKLDDDVQEILQQYAGELVDELATMSGKLAQARKSKTLDIQDVRFYLEHNWNMYIPGFGADAIRVKRKIPETEAHKNRQAIIKKHLKKF